MNGGNMKVPTPPERWHPPMTEAQHAFLDMENFISDARQGDPMGARMADEYMRVIRTALTPPVASPTESTDAVRAVTECPECYEIRAAAPQGAPGQEPHAGAAGPTPLGIADALGVCERALAEMDWLIADRSGSGTANDVVDYEARNGLAALVALLKPAGAEVPAPANKADDGAGSA